MNRKEAIELLPFIQAFAEGRTVEFKDRRFKDEWDEMSEFPDYSFKYFEFRIKPKLEYRPFKNAEECWHEMLKHHPLGWVKDKQDGHYVLITGVDDDTCGMSLNENAAWSLSGIMDLFTFADGVPFGVKLEE